MMKFGLKNADSTRCMASVWVSWGRSRQCTRKPWRDAWCKQHHPDTKKERARKSRADYKDK